MLPKIVSTWRYPVKSMMGEEMNATIITDKGILGDRAYALIDTSTGKLANAKNPQKWPTIYEYRASFVEPPTVSHPNPPVRFTFPEGSTRLSTDSDVNDMLSESLKRNVKLITPSNQAVQFEGYIPNMEELVNKDSVFTRTSPEGTFFDISMLHILTTSTINKLRSIIPGSRVEVRRFRPNIVIEVPEDDGFIENDWVGRTLRIGDQVRLQIVQPTLRCVMTTLPQGDLPRDPDVLRAAVKYNSGGIGVYATVLKGGHIQRGDTVEVE
ncbi:MULTISPECIES: MOSC domain-containing protein [unclassified Brevibacillus]|uniref:MOSC domain-containing protein n=1 Tax=unclassified Brevibacillus TaxID=2684853 RepID=UPI003566B414